MCRRRNVGGGGFPSFMEGRGLPPELYAWNSHVERESGTAVKDGKEDQFQLSDTD